VPGTGLHNVIAVAARLHQVAKAQDHKSKDNHGQAERQALLKTRFHLPARVGKSTPDAEGDPGTDDYDRVAVSHGEW
jgi:hypothetical protein